MAEMTPMMKHYLSVKEQNPDCIVFYRLGDFYEMFFEDAKTASKELELTLTGRACGLDERAPMCGVPFHAADTYINRLIAKGYKVAICEQIEDPKEAKGMVARDIVRIITPGTVLDDALLDGRISNYISFIHACGRQIAIASADLSTGELIATAFEDDEQYSNLIDEMKRLSPVEILKNAEAHRIAPLRDFIQNHLFAAHYCLDNEYCREDAAERLLYTHFRDKAAALCENAGIKVAVGTLMQYLMDTQKNTLAHMTDCTLYQAAHYLELDETAIRNLELIETISEKKKSTTLLGILNKTKTAGGLRVLQKWLIRPLLNPLAIRRRQEAVETLMKTPVVTDDITGLLHSIRDIERLMGRLSIGTALPKDMIALRDSFSVIPAIKSACASLPNAYLKELAEEMDELRDLYDLIFRAILDEPAQTLREGGIIREGYNEEVDHYQFIKNNTGQMLASLEAAERERTDIKNLRVRFNKVFGYYIEVTNSYLDKVPDRYIRKQTLTNGERFITPELKEIEVEVLSAEEKLTALEYKLYCELRDRLNGELQRIQRTASAIDELDALVSLSAVALQNHYVCPTVDESDEITITAGRHPVVEKYLTGSLFVANDTALNCKESRLAMITGPNMAGKSTYMRQIALIVIMAQMGSFVPAASAHIGIVDRIFTRVGASDDLVGGKSTFAVEMSEVAHIIKNATKKSLLILDEIGRGTSTYDGLAIAWAVAECCSQKIGAKTLFATHYHELTELEEKMQGVKNLCIAVKARGDEITFLRKIVSGGADRSYGIEVAKLCGVEQSVIRRAKEILKEIEEADNGRIQNVTMHVKAPKPQEDAQVSLFDLAGSEILEELRKLDITTLSPIEAMNILYKWQQKEKGNQH